MKNNRWAAIFAVLLLLAIITAAALLGNQAERRAKPRVGLVTSLSIYWDDAASVEQLVSQDGAAHWAREVLEREYELVPLAGLANDGTTQPSPALAGLTALLLAQPRPLEPAEFVALDAWLRHGGRALILADPMLTEHSDLGLGDPRRPQHTSLLSPLFGHWGLHMQLAPQYEDGRHMVAYDGLNIPVDQAGTFTVTGQGEARCVVAAQGLVASCAVGQGRALIVADAALVDRGNSDQSGRHALAGLADRAFSTGD